MPRPVRVEYENPDGVGTRGNERRDIFGYDHDPARLLETLQEAAGRLSLVLHAYCLMPNHDHLLLQTPQANGSQDDTRIQIWIRVRLGGERMTEVAGAYGHRDGSVYQVIPRLQARAKEDRELGNHLRRVTKEARQRCQV